MRTKPLWLSSTILAAVAAFPAAGHAAPQILGLVATTTPLPLTCTDGVCAVEVSGICLQEQRAAPAPGTAYRAAADADLTLVIETRDGATRTVAVAELVDIRSLRLFNAVSVSLPERLVLELAGRELGGRNPGGEIVQASLSVGPLTSLLPVPLAGDPSPLSQSEIRDYTGPLRAIAEDVLGRDSATVSATRSLNRMVNRLPADNTAGADRIAALRQQEMSEPATGDGAAAKGLVDRALETCRELLRVERTPHLRACLTNQHDILNANTTQEVWRHLRPGS